MLLLVFIFVLLKSIQHMKKKTLNEFKTAYLKAKTLRGKTTIFNRAYMNLMDADFKAFIKWQIHL